MPLLCERRGAVAVLTLSRPEARNAWCEEFQTGLRERLPELEADPDIRAVILTGDDRGGAFSAGADLKNPRTHTMDSVAAFLKDLPNRRRAHPIPMLTDFAKPIIAAVNGYAVGIGCIVTYCCDMIVASERAEWRLPQSGLGIIPAQGGATRLARWVGKGLAMRTGVRLSAEGGGGVSHRPRAMAGAARRADGAGDGGGGAHCLAATAGDAAHQGVAQSRNRCTAGGCGAGRSVSLRHAGDDRGQAGSASSVAGTQEAQVQGKLIEGDKGETLWLKQCAPSSLIHPAVKG